MRKLTNFLFIALLCGNFCFCASSFAESDPDVVIKQAKIDIAEAQAEIEKIEKKEARDLSTMGTGDPAVLKDEEKLKAAKKKMQEAQKRLMEAEMKKKKQ